MKLRLTRAWAALRGRNLYDEGHADGYDAALDEIDRILLAWQEIKMRDAAADPLDRRLHAFRRPAGDWQLIGGDSPTAAILASARHLPR